MNKLLDCARLVWFLQGPETLVSILSERGDPAAESNAHRLSLSLQTASRFITDVLERSISATLRSTIVARENLLFSLQSVENDSTRMVELVDSTSETVADAAKKAKQEMNEAIRTSLHHLAESIKIILRALPPSPLNEQRLLTIIDAAQYRMEIVVENAGQRINQALQSYRGHLLKVDKDSGELMVDGPSTQQATDVLKNVIQASQTQIESAVVAGTSFILTRIRSYLAGEPSLDAPPSTSTIVPSILPFSTTTTNQLSTVSSTSLLVQNDHLMEDPQHEEVGSASTTVTTSPSTMTEPPMVINTSTKEPEVDSLPTKNMPSTSSSPLNSTLDGIQIHKQDDVTVGTVDAVSLTGESSNTTVDSIALGPAFSWQDDLLMSFHEANESFTSATTPSAIDDDMAGWPAVRQAATRRPLPFTSSPKRPLSTEARTRK